jgi:TolB-like protein
VTVTAALLALALVVGAAGPQPAPPRKVAVWTIQAAQGVTPGAAQVLEDVVATELAKTGRFQVIARGDLAAALGYAQQQRALGCSEQACLAQIGTAAGADLVLSGQAGQLGTQYRLSLLLVDSKRGVAVARAARFSAATEDALAAIVPAVVGELVAATPAPGAAAAPTTAAALLDGAEALSKQGRHADAAAEYDRYPALFPDGKERCLAMFQAGVAWEAAGRKPLAAERLLLVGSDARCQQSGPNAAGSALARAGALYEGLGRAEDAREAFRRLVALPGVSDSSLRAKVEAARMRLDVAPAGR